MIDFWKRVKRAIPVTLNQTWLCEQIGISTGTMSSWITNNRIPKADMAVKIAAALDLTTEFLVTGENRPHAESPAVENSMMVKIPVEPRTIIPEHPAMGDHIIVPRALVRHRREASLGAVQVRGDSMIDEQLVHGDVAIYTHGHEQGDGLYVLDINQEILVRRIQFNPYERTMTVLPGNQRYNQTQTIPMDHEGVRILGKVVAWYHRNV